MPHGDIDLPSTLSGKADFYAYLADELLSPLLEHPQANWVTSLSNASALLYHAFRSYRTVFGVTEDGEPVVNWSGFYLDSSLFPSSVRSPSPDLLLLGPFHGRPACQTIRKKAGKGVCADAFVSGQTVVVQDVEAYPGHIACDGATKSEIVIPLLLPPSSSSSESPRKLGVLDLDSIQLGTFDDDDRVGLERIAALVVQSCDW